MGVSSVNILELKILQILIFHANIAINTIYKIKEYLLLNINKNRTISELSFLKKKTICMYTRVCVNFSFILYFYFLSFFLN